MVHRQNLRKKNIKLKKKWFEKGEVEAKDRPKNSLLKADLKFKKQKIDELSDFFEDKKEIERRIREGKFDNECIEESKKEEEELEVSGEGDEEIIEPLLSEFEKIISKCVYKINL